MSSRAVVVLVGLALGALASCNDQSAAAPGVAPPVVGDIAGTGATPTPAAPTARLPKASKKEPAPPTTEAAAPSPPADARPATPGAQGAVGVPAGFEPAQYCLMPKLSTCSIYGKKYNKLDAVQGFCGKLGGELTSYCPSANLVARCKTSADVLTHYYATGEKGYTREAAEAKCKEKSWEVLPLP